MKTLDKIHLTLFIGLGGISLVSLCNGYYAYGGVQAAVALVGGWLVLMERK